MSEKHGRKPLVPIDAIDFRRCGAKSKRTGNPCPQPAMKNGRCRFHGGHSTGPKTPEGIERIKLATTKHGFYTQAAMAERHQERDFLKEMEAQLRVFLQAPG